MGLKTSLSVVHVSKSIQQASSTPGNARNTLPEKKFPRHNAHDLPLVLIEPSVGFMVIAYIICWLVVA